MTTFSSVDRRPLPARFRPLKLAGLALCASAGLTLAACQKGPGGFTGGEADLALQTLRAAPEHGFPAERFHVARIEQMLGSSSPGDKAQGGRELRAALIDYARAQHGLTIPKSAFPHDWGLKPAAYDAEADLGAALQQHRLKAWLADLPPPLPAYQALQKAYVSYLKLETAGGWPTVSADALLPGAPDAAALRQRLAYEDPQLSGDPQNADLAGAVQRFQAAHGLAATGQIDPATLAALNAPPAAYAAQIRANLERLRWMSRVEPPTRIDVNTAAAEMDYYAGGHLATHMLAVSGRPGGDETPMLSSKIDSIVLNPPWNVPQQIAEEEILPKGAAYLRAKGFVREDGRLVQKPGPEAALGLVKFEFDNPYAVYLHDTPAKAAFARTQRAVSHGCVRLAKAVDLAKTLLSNEPGWSAERVDQTLASGDTIHVKLTHTIPVRLVYLTAFPADGRIAFRPDLYGWDSELLQLLDHPPAAKTPGKRA